MKKTLILSVIFCCVGLLKLSAQQPVSHELDRVVSSLQHYMSERPQEKVHIHFDKPFYSVGDTVWFKAYVVNAQGNRLSSISKVIHLDILKPDGSSKKLLLPVTSGMSAAQLVLSDSLFTAGDYQLRAYTQWMRNVGEAYFFHHTLRVASALHYRASASAVFSNGSQGLTAEVTYRSARGESLSGQQVDYKLKQGERAVFAGKLSTGADGRAGIVFPADKLPETGTLVLETSTPLSSGAVLSDRFIVPMDSNRLSLQFFPEGGWLVEGIRSKVAFKAVGIDGLGIPTKGYIENGKGEQVAAFQSGRLGMGVFALLPLGDESYTAVLDEGSHKGQRFALPKAKPDGYVLTVNRNATDDLNVRISRPMGNDIPTAVGLVVQSSGEARHAVKLPMAGASISFTIAKSKLGDGINQLTLFSDNNLPLAERLVFVQHEQLPTVLTSDKPEYAMREQVKLSFDNGHAAVGGYSVAVVKADRIALAEEKQLSIYANLLLSADLKGHIEDPNYYFTDPDGQKAAELDVLLLAQGWRRFSWEEVLSGKVPPARYKAQDGLQVSGTVVTLIGGRPVPGAKIKLLATKEMLFLDTVADSGGRFAFNGLQLGDSVEVVLRASGAKESNKVKIILDQLEEMSALTLVEIPMAQRLGSDTAMRAYLTQTSSLFDQMQRTGKIIQGTTLKTVEVVTKRKAPEIKGSAYPFAAAPPDYTIEPDKLQEMVNLETYLKGLSGIVVKGNEVWGRGPSFDEETGVLSVVRKEGKMTLLLNGMKIDDLSGINPRGLTGVQIVTGSAIAAGMATSLMLPANSTSYGIVFLTMKGIPEKFIKPNRPPGFLQFPLLGYTYAREFYVPDYTLQKDSPGNDFRSTLFWKPDIFTDKDGKAEFSFFASDEQGRFKVTLEGIGVDGQLCRKIGYFEVK